MDATPAADLPRRRRVRRGAGALALAALLAACRDEVPTAVGDAFVPAELRPTTVVLDLATAEAIPESIVFDGFANPYAAGLQLVATDFGGPNGLFAHVLFRIRGFPDTLVYSSGGQVRRETDFRYGAGTFVVRVDTTQSIVSDPVTLELWSVAQPFDPGSATWELAVDTAGDRRLWQMPGGTRGELLATATFVPRATNQGDSVVFALDSLAVEKVARQRPGVLVRLRESTARLELRLGAVLRTRARPASRPDTAIVQELSDIAPRGIFSPTDVALPGLWKVGGLTAARTVLRLVLPTQVPRCNPPRADCAKVPLRSVVLNAAELRLQPRPVPRGFYPARAASLAVYRVLEPALGRRSPIALAVPPGRGDTIPARVFATAVDTTVTVRLTSFLRSRIEQDSLAVTVALLSPLEGAVFGALAFAPTGQLRLIYTVPQTPSYP